MTTTNRQSAEITGIVHPLRAGGAKGNGDEWWRLVFHLSTWRDEAGNIQTNHLRLEKTGFTDEQLRVEMERINPYQVLRLEVIFLESPNGERTQAELEKIIGEELSDLELNAIATGLQQPVTGSHPDLGIFTLNRELNCYETEIDWCGTTVQLSISPSPEEEPVPFFPTALSLFRAQQEWDQRIKDFAVQEMLELSHHWQDDEEDEEITPERFKERITLTSINVDDDGRFSFWFDDGDLFFGHVIVVSGTLANGLKNAQIMG